MNVDNIIQMAKQAPGDYTISDAISFFGRINLGHWPSEGGIITMTLEDGEIIIEASRKDIRILDHEDVPPSGIIWLLSKFFEQFEPKATYALKMLEQHGNIEADPKKFRQKVFSEMIGKSQFVKIADNRLAFAESKQVYGDGSSVIAFNTTNLDKDDSTRHTVIIPGAKPVVMVHQQSNGKIMRFKVPVSGAQLEALESWELAAMSAAWSCDPSHAEPVTEEMLNDLVTFSKTPKTHSQNTEK